MRSREAADLPLLSGRDSAGKRSHETADLPLLSGRDSAGKRSHGTADLPFRLVRSAAFAAVCVLLAAMAHQLAGGDEPTAWTLIVAAAGVFAGAATLAGCERSPVLITSMLLVAQGGLHELFNHGATVKAILASRLWASVPAAAGDHQAHGLGISLGMLIAHITAALVTAWWVARGETALWSVLRRIGIAAVQVLLRLFAPADTTAQVALRRVAHGWRHLGLPRINEPLRYIVVRRGPPLPS
ncbi:hypothetical protein Aple_057400 [Acrocarpospora pleiomorpha]|uniref:Uncharacterized protein n=1 Tax=Acrocarpospora pleiomorpha TaxID=90975 RepID=A0A5M3XTN5_9ACTN|nr:hypothetical protein Aple_057400 [Acrocarpospora pleiomorpha]